MTPKTTVMGMGWERVIRKSTLLQNSLGIQRFLGCSRLGLGVGVLVGALHGDGRFRGNEELLVAMSFVVTLSGSS